MGQGREAEEGRDEERDLKKGKKGLSHEHNGGRGIGGNDMKFIEKQQEC